MQIKMNANYFTKDTRFASTSGIFAMPLMLSDFSVSSVSGVGSFGICFCVKGFKTNINTLN